jgi:integrase
MNANYSLNKDAHNPPRSLFWYVSFRDQRGRRVRKSTKTADRTEANKIAMKWAEAAQAGREKRLTEVQCRKVLADLFCAPLHFRTCRDYLTEWLKGVEASVDENTHGMYETTIHSFLDHMGTSADKELQDIASADIRQWRDKLTAKGLSAPTVNGHLRVLRIPFNAAHDLGHIATNPCGTKAVKPVRDDVEDTEKDVFTPEQLSALINTTRAEDWKGLILCGYFTGLRLGDCSDLQWRNVDLDKKIITVTPHKTCRHGTKVRVPIHPQLLTWLRRQTRGIEKAPVFPTLAGKNTGGRSGLSTGFKRIMDKTKIKGRLLREKKGVGRSRSSLSFHSLRHSFNSALANAGVDVELRQALTGHASAEQNETYTHREHKVKQAAVSKVPWIPEQREARGR